MGKKRNSQVWWGKREGMRIVARPKCGRKHNIEKVLKETGWEGVDRTAASCEYVKNARCAQNVWNFLTYYELLKAAASCSKYSGLWFPLVCF
jgi:hypothetical protein